MAKEAQASSHQKKNRKRESRLTKGGAYRSTCKGQWFTKGGKKRWQAHHIVCEHAIAARFAAYKGNKDKMQYMEDCLWITPWNINDSANLVGLPLNWQYRATDGTEPVDRPSHQVDHNTSDGYTIEVRDWLEKHVWKALSARKTSHDVKAENILKQLKQCENTFKKKLERRGKRGPKGSKGTTICWRRRHEKRFEWEWYKPFSMGKFPRKRHPGAKSAIARRMTNVFKQIE